MNLQIIDKKAAYAFTMTKGFEKNLELLENEEMQVLESETGEDKKAYFRGVVSLNRISRNPAIIIITNFRLIFFIHHIFGADRLVYIPFEKIQNVRYVHASISDCGQRWVECSIEGNQKVSFGMSAQGAGLANLEIRDELSVIFLKLLSKSAVHAVFDETVKPGIRWDLYFLGAFFIFLIIFDSNFKLIILWLILITLVVDKLLRKFFAK